MTFFLILLYQDSEVYATDCWPSDATPFLLVFGVLFVILFPVFFWWIRRRNRSLARIEYMTDEPDNKKGNYSNGIGIR
jgi:hypothetical protein